MVKIPHNNTVPFTDFLYSVLYFHILAYSYVWTSIVLPTYKAAWSPGLLPNIVVVHQQHTISIRQSHMCKTSANSFQLFKPAVAIRLALHLRLRTCFTLISINTLWTRKT